MALGYFKVNLLLIYTAVGDFNQAVQRLVFQPASVGIAQAVEFRVRADVVSGAAGRRRKPAPVLSAPDCTAESVVIRDPDTVWQTARRESISAEFRVDRDISGARTIPPVAEIGWNNLLSWDGFLWIALGPVSCPNGQALAFSVILFGGVALPVAEILRRLLEGTPADSDRQIELTANV